MLFSVSSSYKVWNKASSSVSTAAALLLAETAAESSLSWTEIASSRRSIPSESTVAIIDDGVVAAAEPSADASSWKDPFLAVSGILPRSLPPTSRATRPTVLPSTNPTVLSATITTRCLLENFAAGLVLTTGVSVVAAAAGAAAASSASASSMALSMTSTSSSDMPGRPISLIRFSSSRFTMPCVTAPMTLSVGHGLVICFRVGHSAPVMSVDVSNNFFAFSMLRTLEDWSFSKMESQPPPAPPPPLICPPFSRASAPRPSRGPPFHDQ
mmetsp:Transcript_5197/g.11741  ORF Transcript_5197/g.11741 Transcript_5197/m.11741 type:complete len:269 (-) Transcript_5197:1174-1980(-)